ncbi:MAG: hypothetical protein MJK04_35970 [Psychrosphaera sp.]|nr:hypothetical protein [Psychrosphaera sp.]
MSVLIAFEEQTQDRYRYKAHLDAMRIRWSQEYVAKQQKQQLEAATAELAKLNAETLEAALAAEQSQLEIKRLEAQLREIGIEP